MNINEKNTALYEKMAAEQNTFRDWLKSQPPEEVLNHAYEYTVREDIVMAMEELELSDRQAQALLDSPSPLADVYRHFEKLETGYMDVIRESIEERAKEAWDLSWERKDPKDIPVYPHSADYAREHEETALFRASHQANVSCKEAIEAAVSLHYGNNRLGEGALPQVVEQFGLERTLYVLANTVQQKDHDGRISRDNKAWAATVPIAEVQDLFGFDHRREFVVDKCNSYRNMKRIFCFTRRQSKPLRIWESRSCPLSRACRPSTLSCWKKRKKTMPSTGAPARKCGNCRPQKPTWTG